MGLGDCGGQFYVSIWPGYSPLLFYQTLGVAVKVFCLCDLNPSSVDFKYGRLSCII